MAIPKNVPGSGGAQNRPQGGPQNPSGGGIPRMQNSQLPKQGLPNQSNRPSIDNNRPEIKSNRPDFELPPIDVSDVPSNTREYGFDDSSAKLSRISNQPRGPIKNPYDKDEDTFTTLSIDEQLDYDSKEDIADREAREREELIRKARVGRLAREREEERLELERLRQIEDDLLSRASDVDEEDEEDDEEIPTKSSKEKPSKNRKSKVKENKKDKNGQDVFINEKTMQLETFGGKRKVKVNDNDGRKNLRQRSQIIQYIIVGLVIIMTLFAGKNAFFPQKALSEEEIGGLITDTVGITQFPLESGKGFAKDFMEAYLTVNADAASKSVLGYYYNGVLGAADNPNRTTSQGFKQTILYGPTVYEAVGLTDYSARYTIGALVEPTPARGEAPADGASAKWTYFNVNVYYDVASDSFSITPDSPSVIPSVEVGSQTNIPAPAPLGTEEVDAVVSEEIRSVVHGFIKGYAVSSPIDHSNLDQYIASGSDKSLQKGLNNTFTLAGTEEESIFYTAYNTAYADQLKVAVVVNWRDQLGVDDVNTKLDYKSNYVMTLEKQTNGKYLVTKFAPQYYVMDEQE